MNSNAGASSSAAAKREALQARDAALARLAMVIGETVAEGDHLEAELMAKARRIVDDHAFGNLERVAGAASANELEATAKQLAEWWKQPAFETDAERWQGEAKATLDEWFQRSADLIARTIDAPRFKAIVADASQHFDPTTLASQQQGWRGKVLTLVAEPLKGATRDVVYFVGKKLGANFRPWGAVKLARNLGRFSVAVGVVATVFDTIDLYREWKREERRDQLRKTLRGFVEETAAQLLKLLTDGNEEAAGPMLYVRSVQDHLRAAGRDLSSVVSTK